MLAALLLAATPAAHHAILAKFDDTKPATLNGIVTLVDWANPHVHVFMNVRDAQGQILNWAVELESPIDLKQQRLEPRNRCSPATRITVQGISARNGSRQAWARSVVMTKPPAATCSRSSAPPPPAPLSPRPTPKWPDGRPGSAPLPGADGYWGYPSATVMVENGVKVDMDEYGLLKNVADAAKVAPMQPWALALYRTGSGGSCRTTRCS